MILLLFGQDLPAVGQLRGFSEVRLHHVVSSFEELTASTVTEGEAIKLNRKMLLDLRDSLRSFLTMLEGK